MNEEKYLEDGYNWKEYSKNTYRDFQKAIETGDLRYAAGHCLYKGGELEIGFALDLARYYFNVKPEGNVLDVGCGTGYMTYCWQKMDFQAIGFEILTEGVELARKTFPDIDFFQGNGTKPKKYFGSQEFNFVFIREFHPFSRINDFGFQILIIEDYLDVLKDDGILIIDQSRRRDCPNLDVERVKEHFAGSSVRTVGPLFFFPHKHLGIPPRFKIVNKTLSFLTNIYTIFRRQYPVEFFLISKRLGSDMK